MRRFLSRVLPLLLSFGLIFNCTGCSTVLVLAGKARENSEASSSVIPESSASSGIISTPVPTEDGDLRAFYTDVANAESVTVMVYMIGSDLESEDGSATDDLLEMADAALSENVHLVLQTGGTETWWNDVCTDDESERFVIENGDMTLLQSLGSMNMTDADTLSDFIRFSAESYPADRYELILWDHGGGTMTGFGYDELYEDTSLTLSSLSTALYNGGVQFDFIGFDACLMATAEVAYALDPYADYLIASEESEPGEGWAYKNWLTMLAEDPAVPTAELGKKLADDFLEAYIFRRHADAFRFRPALCAGIIRRVGKLLGKRLHRTAKRQLRCVFAGTQQRAGIRRQRIRPSRSFRPRHADKAKPFPRHRGRCAGRRSEHGGV